MHTLKLMIPNSAHPVCLAKVATEQAISRGYGGRPGFQHVRSQTHQHRPQRPDTRRQLRLLRPQNGHLFQRPECQGYRIMLAGAASLYLPLCVCVCVSGVGCGRGWSMEVHVHLESEFFTVQCMPETPTFYFPSVPSLSLSSLQTHSGSVWRVTWAHPEYGQVLATCSFDRTVCVWEEQSEHCTLSFFM